VTFGDVHGDYMKSYQETSQVCVMVVPLCQLPEAHSTFGTVREALLCYLCGVWQGLEHRLDILERCLDPESAKGVSSDLPSCPVVEQRLYTTYNHLEHSGSHAPRIYRPPTPPTTNMLCEVYNARVVNGQGPTHLCMWRDLKLQQGPHA